MSHKKNCENKNNWKLKNLVKTHRYSTAQLLFTSIWREKLQHYFVIKIENILFDQWRHSYLNFDQQFCRDVSSFASSSIYEVIDLYLSFLTDKQASSNLPNAKSNDLLPR